MTPSGPRAAGLLSVGDAVLTFDQGALPILWIGRHTIPAGTAGHLCAAERGALGPSAPRRRLRLSPRTGVLRYGLGTLRGYLMNACDLPDFNMISEGVTYIQLVLASHSLIAVDGVPIETLHPERIAQIPGTAALRAALLAAVPTADHGLYGPECRPRAHSQG